MNYRERVHERLMNYMREHACSLPVLAKEIGVYYWTLKKYVDKASEPHLKTLLKIERYLDKEIR